MQIHYLSDNLFDLPMQFILTHYDMFLGIVFLALLAAFHLTYKNDKYVPLTGAFALILLFCVPLVQTVPSSFLSQNVLDRVADRYIYHQPDYIIDTSTTYQLYEADDTHHHPTKEGWADTPTGQIKGQISDPQGQMTQVKHGKPDTDLVEITYTIGDVEHKATVHVPDDKCVKLWQTVKNKPLPLSVLDNGDFVVDHYSQATDHKK